MKLTYRQARVFVYVRMFINDHGYAPSTRQIMAGCGINSTSVVRYTLRKLEDADMLKVHPGISRGIVLMEKETT